MKEKEKSTKRQSKKLSKIGKKYSKKSLSGILNEEHELNQETEYQISSLNDPIALKTIIDFTQDLTDKKYILLNLIEVFKEKYVGEPIKFVGYVNYISEGYPVTLSLSRCIHRFTAHSLSFEDLDGTAIKVIPIINDFHKEELKKISSGIYKITFYGTVVSIDQPLRKGYEFLLSKIDEALPASELLKIDDRKKQKYDAILEKAQNGEINLRDFIKEIIVKNIGIKGLDSAKELSTALDFTILQSFSQGKSIDGRYSNKLHSLVIGPPAIGKKLITQTALALNTFNFEVPPTAAKVTAAGLIGNVIRKSGGITTKPGILSNASNGVVCIQDYHELAKKKNSNFSDILSKVMEDGEVIDSTSSRTVLPALTSIHLDTNRLSQVNGTEDTSIHNDLKIPINIISRFDFIIDIPYDIQRQISIALDMMHGNKLLGNREDENVILDWVIELRYLVEKTKEKFNRIELNEDVTAYLKMKLEKFLEGNSKYLNIMKTFGSMLTRIQISLEKILKAMATSEMSNTVKEEHVDEAFEFLRHKLEFLQKLDPLEIPNNLGTHISEPKRREEIILKMISQKSKIKAEEMLKGINNEMKKEYNIKTIQRDLKQLKQKNKIKMIKKGVWTNAE